ncbi:DUF3102 domain-containing protein [Candidatus Atribacteria bacterium 1244-E10-H5-B2]|nr:MAG: DUF3102 domain-containing protein [Candidatus Atribacteria bacterium 1244-E10-H5-B2]
MLPEKSRIAEIIRIHNELQKLYYSGLDRAIQLGELLDEQKKSLKYGEFVDWVNKNLPFSERTARNYRVIFKNREFLKRKVVSSLDTAYLLLKKSKIKEERIEEQKEERRKRFEEAKERAKEYDRMREKKHKIKYKVTYSVSSAGYKLKSTLPGHMSPDMPDIECIDPEYIKLEEGKADWQLIETFRYIVECFNKAMDSLNKLYREYGDEMFTAYTVNYDDGQVFKYPELIKAYKRVIKKADFYLKKGE